MARSSKSSTEEKKNLTPQEVGQDVQEGTAPQEVGQTSQNKKRNPTVNAPKGLNLRDGPHKSYTRLAVLDDGAEVEILPLPGDVMVPGWYLVTTPGYTGWVDAEFLHIPEEA